MEQVTIEKKVRAAEKKPIYSTITLRTEVAKKVRAELERLNNKKFGRRVDASSLFTHLLVLINDEGRRKLQETSMSNKDLIERDYQEYCATKQKIMRDEYFGLLRSGMSNIPKSE